MKNFKDIKQIVHSLIVQDRKLCDDDKKLCWFVWRKLLHCTTPLSLNWSMYKELPSESTITRARRQLEQLHPNLRGETWLKRQGQLQEEAQIIIKDCKYENID